MEPNVGPLPSMDPHDPSSIQERSESPSLLSNSLMAGFSQDGDLERGDDDVNSLHKSAFFGNSKRRHRSSAFSSSLTWDSDSEKETFDEEELQQLSNPHGLAAHSPGSPTCDQKQDKIDCGVYRTPEQPKKSMLDKNLSKSLDAQGHSRDACKDPGMVQSSTQQCVKKHKSGCVPDQVGPLSSDTKPKEGCQKEKEEEKEFEQKRKEIKRAPERDVYTFPGDSDPESPPPGPWAHCTFIQRRRKKRALLRPFSGLNPWQCTPGTGRKTRVNPSRTKECSKFVKDKKGVFEFKEEEEEKVQDKELSREVKEELCQEIYTCVECSIYFKKAAHLREHMQEHGQDSGSKGQIGEDNSRRRRAKKSVSECTECGQNFADRLMLLDHHRRHQEKRNKILKEMEKLKEGRKRASCRNSRKPDEESMANSSQFVCLKCNYSSNVPRELAKHAKTHTARTKASGPRVSPRFQRKSCRKAWTRHSGNAASTTVVSDRYPTRASVQTGGSKPEVNHLQAKDCDPQSENKADLFPGPSQNHTLTTDPAEPTDKPELESAQTEAAPPASPCLQEESGSAEVGLGEENASKLQSPEPSLTNVKAETQQKDVVFKVTENRSSKRVGRRVIRRMKARRRLYPKCTNITDTSINMQNTEETTELNDKASVLPDPKENLSPANRTDVETSAPDLDLNAPFPPKASEDFKKETKEETPPESEKDECSQNTTVEKDIDDKINDLVDVNDGDDDDDKDDDDDGDDDGGDDQNENVSDNEDNDDIVNHLLEVLTEEEEAEDEEGILLQSVEKKCPYCQDCFDNGIGLANHIRGHLNRVGVSYKVRHFISPEEVNAIEKKFSYQKKKKKVANFDPATFSVMRCEFCSAGFDTRAGLSSHARAHLRDFGITNWEVTASPINVLRELFSKQPELALSITPAFNPETQDKTCKEEEESMLVNDGGTSESMLHITASTSQSWRKRQNEDEADGGNDKEEGNEQLHVQDDFNSSPGSNSSAAEEETGAKGSSLLKCEVCCALFETRRGLSSHARSHLRQLGVRVSESSGAPIDLLYQITMDRATDSHLSASPQSHSPTPSPQNTHLHTFCASAPSPKRSAEFEDEQEDIKPLSCLHNVAKSSPCPSSPSPSGLQPSSPFGRTPSPSHSLSASPSPVLRKAPISSLLPVSSPLRSPELRTMSRAHNSALSSASSRTLWASRETETPLNLTMDMDSHTDIICKLCGAWFETRKGLSSHARAHLRHFGVEYAESKGSPIDLLNTLILTDDFKRRATSFCPDSPEDLRVHGHNMAPLSPSTSTPNSASKRPLHSNSVLLKNTSLKSSVGSKSTSSSSSSSTHTLLRPPTKKLKTSSQQVFRMSGRDLMSIPLAEPMKDVCCEFCGELFENRKGLSSHARSHLRQLGITEWSVNGSPIDTLRDLITRRGLPCVMPLKPLKSSSCSPSPGPPQTLHQYSSTHGGVMGRQTFTFSQHQPAKMAVSSPVTSTSPTMLMVKPKPEPEQIEITVTGGGHEGYSSESLHPSWMSSDNAQSVNMLMTQEREPSRDIRCEFCGEFFENRKGLSSHARSHLRHMGITEWSVNGSPIDTLWEIMRNQSNTSASVVLGVKKEPEQESSSPYDSQGHQSFHVSPKASINLLHSGSRLHKHGFRSTGLSTTAPAGKFLGMKPTGKRFLGHAGHLGQRSPVTQSKTLSQPPQGFSSKGRLSTDKYGVGRIDASCELCGFAFENRKALASHARAHLRQFGVTEWSVNGSPIETLSAWMRSQPQTVAELHRSYLSDGPVAPKKKQSAAQWASLALSQGRTVERQIMSSSWSSLSRAVEVKNQNGTAFHHGISTQDKKHHSSSAIPHIQVARSELNVRVTRGIERRPLKHPLHADGGERESCPPKPTRTSTVPALVPKPPSTPLVKLVGKMYSLKCRFCDVEFHGPLSVQEDWIRHLQQHILKLDYNKPAPIANNTPAKSEMAVPEIQASATTSTSVTTTATTGPTPTSATSLKPTSVFTPCPPVSTTAPTPTLTPTLTVPTLTSSGNPTKAKQEVDTPAT